MPTAVRALSLGDPPQVAWGPGCIIAAPSDTSYSRKGFERKSATGEGTQGSPGWPTSGDPDMRRKAKNGDLRQICAMSSRMT